MNKIILETFNKIDTKGKKRKLAKTQCPDCGLIKEVRFDSVKSSETTCCRSCLNLRRDKKPEEDKFNALEHYHSVPGRCTSIYNAQKMRSIKYGWAPPSYTRLELQEWMEAQLNCKKLFNDWEKSNYSKDYSPSVDRLDDYKPYSLNNIRLVPWHINNEKMRQDVKKGTNAKKLHGVIQLDLDKNIINKFHSLKEAERQTSIHSGSISRAARKKQTAGGFFWETLYNKPSNRPAI